MWKLLFKSAGLILGIAGIIGAGIGYITNSWISFWITFFISIVAQFAINSMFQASMDRKNKNAEFLAEQVLREAAERQMPFDLNCAYCNTLNRIGISFSSENSFNCTSCRQPNKVYIQFSTVRITTPLTQKGSTTYVDMDEDAGVSQSTINEPIRVNEEDKK